MSYRIIKYAPTICSFEPKTYLRAVLGQLDIFRILYQSCVHHNTSEEKVLWKLQK